MSMYVPVSSKSPIIGLWVSYKIRSFQVRSIATKSTTSFFKHHPLKTENTHIPLKLEISFRFQGTYQFSGGVWGGCVN